MLMLVPVHASDDGLSLNFTQADRNGINLMDLDNSLETITGMDMSVLDDSSDPFNPDIDLISLDSSMASLACDSGQLADLGDFDELGSYQSKNDFVLNHKDNCTITYATYSLVVAYPLLRLVTTHPASPADLFDIERFPGDRALPDSHVGTLEWALLSYGIPRSEVYQLLSTERGMNLAFARLNKIKRHIIWWDDVEELKALLANKQVVMAAGPHTAFYDVQYSAPMEIVWNGQLLVEMKLGINAASGHAQQSVEFIRYLMSDEVQFELAYQFGFGPASISTLNRLGLLPQSGTLMPFIPTHPANMESVVWLDHNWHRQLESKVASRFREWREGGP